MPNLGGTTGVYPFNYLSTMICAETTGPYYNTPLNNVGVYFNLSNNNLTSYYICGTIAFLNASYLNISLISILASGFLISIWVSHYILVVSIQFSLILGFK